MSIFNAKHTQFHGATSSVYFRHGIGGIHSPRPRDVEDGAISRETADNLDIPRVLIIKER